MSRISSSIIVDHQDLRQYYQEYQAASGEVRFQLAQRLSWKLAMHTIAEEIVLYPAVERELGAEVAAADRAEHDEVKAALAKIEASTDPAAADELIQSLFTKLSAHFTDEETNQLPALEEKLSDEENLALYTKFERSRDTFSKLITLPADKRPFNSTVALFSTPLDKLPGILLAAVNSMPQSQK
ncbi:hypothetical protein DL93DRAFT_762574 [Clavulina sp. PMI_390]|nr:hypothetical protein DL93DRAFT_762574 [Clavulina sp. PMI_390]